MSDEKFLEIEVGGEAHRLAAIGLEVQFQAAERLRSERDADFERSIAACGRLEGAALRFALELTFAQQRQIVSDARVLTWLGTLEGAVFTLWQSLRGVRPEATEEDARNLYKRLTPAQSARIARFLAQGMKS